MPSRDGSGDDFGLALPGRVALSGFAWPPAPELARRRRSPNAEQGRRPDDGCGPATGGTTVTSYERLEPFRLHCVSRSREPMPVAGVRRTASRVGTSRHFL